MSTCSGMEYAELTSESEKISQGVQETVKFISVNHKEEYP